jgi:hypothetical protein
MFGFPSDRITLYVCSIGRVGNQPLLANPENFPASGKIVYDRPYWIIERREWSTLQRMSSTPRCHGISTVTSLAASQCREIHGNKFHISNIDDMSSYAHYYNGTCPVTGAKTIDNKGSRRRKNVNHMINFLPLLSPVSYPDVCSAISIEDRIWNKEICLLLRIGLSKEPTCRPSHCFINIAIIYIQNSLANLWRCVALRSWKDRGW